MTQTLVAEERSTKAARRGRRVTGRGRGFASMSLEKRREIASKGGKEAHRRGTAHKWTPLEAQHAGSIGGRKSRRPKRNMQAV